MALRGFVTGSDACTPSDGGAGPSNAAASLANTLLGRSSKAQEQLHELPGIQGLPGTSGGFQGPRTPAEYAAAAAEGESIAVPGVVPAFDVERDVAKFLGGSPQLPGSYQHMPHHMQQQQQPPPWQQQRHATAASPVAPFLQAFLNSAKAHTPLRPLPAPSVHLSTAEQCRIRDRSTIMARHLFADRGDAYADQQVGALMQSLNIDPHNLPAQHQEEWDSIFQAGPQSHHHAMQSAEQAAASRQVHAAAQEFERLQMNGQAGPSQQWAEEFGKPAPQGPQAWAQEFAEHQQRPEFAWAEEFGRQQAEGTATASTSQADAASSAHALAQTQALADTLGKDANPKFQNSKFLQFVSKMSRGEIILEDNQAKQRPETAEANGWATEFKPDDAAAARMENVWNDQTASRWAAEHEQQGGSGDWASEFAHEARNANGDWADEFAKNFAAPFTEDGTDIDRWADEYDANPGLYSHADTSVSNDGEYRFAPNNPFLQDTASMDKGRELFRSGLLSEAVLALEAEVQRSPQNVEAWRLLGTVQAENDDDQQAIAALNKAHTADPNNAEVLLALGVSYVNELDQTKALKFLHGWLKQHPNHGAAASSVPAPDDSSQALSHAIQCFQQAAFQAPQDADIHIALGVLFNLAREYDAAVSSLRSALAIQPRDYALWNKLGATLANSAHSSEAISAYQRALDQKPNYMRAWTNMGISQANVGNYEASARYYVRALVLNPRASNVWGYLRNSLACAGLMDLVPAVESEDLNALEQALPL